MINDPMLTAVKTGMKGELDSIAVYEEAAAKSEGEVKDFFAERADEEKKHYNWLLGYYKQLTTNLTPERNAAAELGGDWRSPIMSQDFYRRIGSSLQLSAAVSAAALLEMNAIRHYQGCAESATVPALKQFFESLVQWEERHYHDLIKIQEEAERFYWDINRFEPF